MPMYEKSVKIHATPADEHFSCYNSSNYTKNNFVLSIYPSMAQMGGQGNLLCSITLDPAPTGQPQPHFFLTKCYKGPQSKSWEPRIPDPGLFLEPEILQRCTPQYPLNRERERREISLHKLWKAPTTRIFKQFQNNLANCFLIPIELFCWSAIKFWECWLS